MLLGSFPCLYAELKFGRQVGIYLVNTYIPSVLSVMMSWVSFWIDAKAVPARTTIGKILLHMCCDPSKQGISQGYPQIHPRDVPLNIGESSLDVHKISPGYLTWGCPQ